MSDPTRTIVFDTCVLINFIHVERLDLLAALPGTACVVTDHVRGEITDDYPEQVALFLDATERGLIELLRVDAPEELQMFADLECSGLGIGERSAFVAGFHRGFTVAIDDRRAIRIVSRALGTMPIVGTEGIMRRLIAAGSISVMEADALKLRWETDHKFTLSFKSFGDQE